MRTCPAQVHIHSASLNAALFKDYFLSWIPSVLTTLGVLGTFIGLQIGLSGIEIGEDVDKMLGGIKTLIAGAKTAFNTSIWGVSLGVIFALCLRCVRQRQAHFSFELANRFDSIIPEVSPENEIVKLRQSNDNSSEHLKALTEQIGPRLQETLTAMPAQIGAAIGDEIRGAVGGIGDQNAEALGTALEGIYNEHLADIKGLGVAIANQTVVTDKIINGLQLLHEKLELSSSNLDNSAGSLSEASAKFGKWDSALENYSESMNVSATKFNKASDSLDNAANAIGKSIPEIEGVVGSIKDASTASREKIDEEENEVQSSINDMMKLMTAFKDTSDNLPGVASNLEKASGSLEKLSASMTDAHENQTLVSKNNKDAAEKFQKISGSFEKVTEHLGGLGEASKNLKEASAMAKDSSGVFGDTTIRLTGLTNSFKAIAETFQDVTDAEVGKSFESATISLEKASLQLADMDEVAESLDDAASTAKEVFSQASREHETVISGLTAGVAGLRSELEQLLGKYRHGLEDLTKQRIEEWNKESTNFGKSFTSKVNDLSSSIEDLEESLSKANKN